MVLAHDVHRIWVTTGPGVSAESPGNVSTVIRDPLSCEWALLGSNLIRATRTNLELAARNPTHDTRGKQRNNPKRDKIRGRIGLESCWTPCEWALLGSNLSRVIRTNLELATRHFHHDPRGKQEPNPKRDRIRDRIGRGF